MLVAPFAKNMLNFLVGAGIMALIKLTDKSEAGGCNMKRFILGISLFIGGIIGGLGWIIANMIIFSNGGVSSVSSGLSASGGGFIAGIFVVMAIAGLGIAIYDICIEKNSK